MRRQARATAARARVVNHLLLVAILVVVIAFP
jgi:hypothetical protein